MRIDNSVIILVKCGMIYSDRKKPVVAGSGEPIRLLSCSTGATNTAGNCFAQILANELNTMVIAPNKVLFVNPDGSFYIGSEKEGKLIPFYSRRTE